MLKYIEYYTYYVVSQHTIIFSIFIPQYGYIAPICEVSFRKGVRKVVIRSGLQVIMSNRLDVNYFTFFQ